MALYKPVILKIGQPTESGYVYPSDVVKEAVDRFNERLKQGKTIFGELGSDTCKNMLETSSADASHKVVGLSIVGDKVKSTIVTIPTPDGKMLEKILTKAKPEIRGLIKLDDKKKNVEFLDVITVDFVNED